MGISCDAPPPIFLLDVHHPFKNRQSVLKVQEVKHIPGVNEDIEVIVCAVGCDFDDLLQKKLVSFHYQFEDPDTEPGALSADQPEQNSLDDDRDTEEYWSTDDGSCDTQYCSPSQSGGGCYGGYECAYLRSSLLL
ncbi:MAG: hypothetical protein M1827_001648 [Pycnora praestabilis]|nr:MAG: hypothetical protein M1827_001648 [Pycnora praestabilis]